MTESDKTQKSKIAEKEEEILKFWQENKIFEKSLAKEAPNGNFVFFDGPPFATGLPHYGHVLPGTIKDIIPRYQTMRGKKVARRWGWDCHGLPVENLVEKELGLSSKKDIEIYGVEKFNAAARKSVMRYAEDWKKIMPRVGRWVDMENDYKTMDTNYTESVWWAFKNLFDKGLVYKSFKAMHLCPHCETTLSNFEVNQGYKDIADISVYLKFELKDEPGTYMLAWTTTPWTLPGNVALAVGPEIEYVCIEKKDEGSDRLVKFILGKEALNRVFKNNDYKIVATYLGKDLVGKKYKPLFDYYVNDKNLENRENGWQVYAADFVTTTDGTGIVHIAPAFGEDDMNLGKAKNLPFIQHVNVDGTFKKEVTDFAGQKVKPKDDPNGTGLEHQKADVEVIKFLAKAGTLFEKEKIVHSYPHCWRCDTPLLNYATTSWFVKVSGMREKLLKINKNISWVPKEIGEGRFGKWLEGARDWAISRSRYWGAPLPVWEKGSGELVVLGSIADLKKYSKKSDNKYFVMRHGEAEENAKDFINADIKNIRHLTEEGKKQARIATQDLKKEKIDLIISSPFERCKETAVIAAEAFGLSEKDIIFDERLAELKTSDKYEGKTWTEYVVENFKNQDERFEKTPEGGETLLDVIYRNGELLYDLEKNYSKKNILLISHGAIVVSLFTIANGSDLKEAKKIKRAGIYESHYAEFNKLDFVPLPHDKNYLLDLHRPFIDEIELFDEKGLKMKRIPEVFDCWFESGSMSFAQNHYPFENKEEFDKKNSPLFPADFIAEGLDQTRGWFYTMLVLGASLFDKSPYDSVVVNGIILAEDGRKMAKSLKNYPDLMYIVDKYGADSLRYYLMSSPAVKTEDLNFSEKGVDEVSKKVILKLGNVLSFYEMYADKLVLETNKKPESKNILDQWILIRLNELETEVTAALEKYYIDSATRPFLDFIEDLSIWYIRRSRDRFKSENFADAKEALETTHFVLTELAKLMAPFIPFFAESIYLKLKSENDPESVHLCDWPAFVKTSVAEEEVLNNMKEVRRVVSLALEKRMAAGLKVRQPLNELKIKNKKLEAKEEYLELIKDEVNIKNISFNEKLETEVELDIEITAELQKEGNVRDFIRAVQELRKNKNLLPGDSVELLIETDEVGEKFLALVAEEVKRPTNIKSFLFQKNEGEELKIAEMIFKLNLK